MNAKSLILIVAALLFAGGTAFVASRLMGQKPVQQVQVQEQPGKKVLVAKGNLPAGTFIKEEDISWQKWPTDGVNDNYLLDGTDINTVVGAVVRKGIVAGEPITEAQIARPGDRGFLAAVLTPGMAAVPPSEGVMTRGNGADGADPLGGLAPIIAKLQPIVSQRLIEQGATNLSRHMLALKVGEIASAELEAMHHNLNLLERRTLIGALISSLPATTPDAGGNGQAAATAATATPNVPMTAQAAQVAQQAAASNALSTPGQVKTMGIIADSS